MQTKVPKKKLSLTKILMIVIVLIFFILILLKSSLFQIKEISFEGGEKYSKEEILSKININDETNIFMVRAKYLKRLLEKDPYIKTANIKLKYPSNINIIIKERKVRGYVPYMGSYLYIDEEGRVLNVDISYREQLPVVKGLDFEHFRIGEILEVKNINSFDVVVKTANMMIKYQSEYEEVKDIVEINVSDSKNIHIYIRNGDFLLGDSTDYDYKIRLMLSIIKKAPAKNKGFIDISNPNKKAWIWENLT